MQTSDVNIPMRPGAPAAAAQPARPPGPRGRRRGQRSAGVALQQGAAAPPRILTRRPGVGAEILLPATGPVAVLSGAPFGTFGAWTALDTPANDAWLTRLAARRRTMYTTVAGVLAEYAYGAGPTALDAVRGTAWTIDPTADSVGFPALELNTFNTRVPAGQQLQARLSEGAAQTWDMLATAWEAAVPDFEPLTLKAPAGAGRYEPGNTATGVSVNLTAYPNFGAWSEVVASAPNDLLVNHIAMSNTSGDVQSQLTAYQLGIGAAGAEVAVGTFLVGRGQAPVNIDPPVWLLAGERLAVRGAFIGATTRRVLVKVTDL